MDNQEITHKDEGGKESFKFTQRGYMWLNPETLKWSYCNPAFSLRSLADIKELVKLRKANAELEKGYEELRIAALTAVCKISGGQAKADLRDAYDKATEHLEALKEQPKNKL